MPEPGYYLLADEDDYRSILVRASDGYWLMADGGEPEDATFTRDYAPALAELNRLAAHVAELEAALSPTTTESEAEA